MIGMQCSNEKVKEKVKEKHEAYATLISSKIEEEKEVNKGRHKAITKLAKKVIATAKNTTYKGLYHKFETKTGVKEVF